MRFHYILMILFCGICMEAFCKMQYFKDANFKVCLICGNKSQERKRTAHYIKKKKAHNKTTTLYQECGYVQLILKGCFMCCLAKWEMNISHNYYLDQNISSILVLLMRICVHIYRTFTDLIQLVRGNKIETPVCTCRFTEKTDILSQPEVLPGLLIDLLSVSQQIFSVSIFPR